ncbi:MAG: carbohydrate ABC transporter permease [Propylenella sp.]
MLKSRRSEITAAMVLIAPFVAIYLWLFIYPTIQMVYLTFTNAPLIGDGEWTGLKNYERLFSDRTFRRAVWNTSYFVVLTVVPGTLVALMIAMMISRLRGWLQSVILACFFLPFILPVSVVFLIWEWTFNLQFGIGQYVIEWITGERVAVFRRPAWFLPMVALITIWWTNGFNILLFLAGLRNIPQDVYESAALDGAGRWRQFVSITWPLVWPVTVLVLTIQLILQLKIFDQVYLFSFSGRTGPTMVLVQYVYEQAFVYDKGGYAATVALALFLIIVIFSILQFQALRVRGEQ